MDFIFAIVLLHFVIPLCFVVPLSILGLLLPKSQFLFVVLLVLAATQLLFTFLLWRWRSQDEISCSKEASRPLDLESCVPAVEPPAALPHSACEQEKTETSSSQKIKEVEDLAPLPCGPCQELGKAVDGLRKEMLNAGLRERRLREQLRLRSAALMRLASHLTRAQETRLGRASSASTSQTRQIITRTKTSDEKEPGQDSYAADQPEEELRPQTKLLELANSSPELRDQLLQRLRARGECTAPAEQVTSRPAEAVARKLAQQASELERCREQVEKLQESLKKRDEELSQCREELAARKVINVSAQSADLCLKWMEDGPLPGEAGSAEGMKRLRQNLATMGPAQLCVGPPPADWKVFLQLRLRQVERWEPALLQLSGKDQAGTTDFLGLLWPAE